MATVGTTVLGQCIDTFVTSDREYLSSQVPTGTFRCSVAFFGHYFHLLRPLADALELDDCVEFPSHPEYEGLLGVSLVPWALAYLVHLVSTRRYMTSRDPAARSWAARLFHDPACSAICPEASSEVFQTPRTSLAGILPS